MASLWTQVALTHANSCHIFIAWLCAVAMLIDEMLPGKIQQIGNRIANYGDEAF